MKFIHPSFLWALFFIAIPILIHILDLRKHQTVYFSNVDFLKRVKRENRKRSKIKQLVILACRIAALTALVLAFARPYKPVNGIENKKAANDIVGLYIDNSYSMNAESSEGKALDNAKSKAQMIVSSSRPGTQFILLTNELNQSMTRLFTIREMINLIGEVQPVYLQTQLSTVIDRFTTMTGHFLDLSNKTLYLISDFQKVTASPNLLLPDSITNFNLIPIELFAMSNLTLDSCWFETPSHYLRQKEELIVRIRNNSKDPYHQISIKLSVNDSLKAMATTDLEAGESKNIELNYTNQQTGYQVGKIEILDYPIVYDNTLFFSYLVDDKIKTLTIMPEKLSSFRQRSIEALFSGDPFVDNEIETEERLQISRFSNYATIFLNELRTYPSGLIEALKQFVENGGSLVFIPDERGDLISYNQLLGDLGCHTITQTDTLSIPVTSILYDHPVYRDVFKEGNQKVDLPVIHKRLRFNSNDTIFETSLMGFADQTKALSISTLGRGRVIVFSFQISSEENRFTEHLLFVPTLFNLVLTSSTQQDLYHQLHPGIPVSVNLASNMQVRNPRMESLSNDKLFYPTARKSEGNRISLFMDELPDAGHYRLILDDQLASILAFNYQLSESDFSFYTPDEMKNGMKKAGIRNIHLLDSSNNNFESAIEEVYSGRQYWRFFLLLALIVLIGEAFIIKFWKE